jgi:alkylation response protein AidB-like acyl-CoA dehydrogenase
MSSAAGLAWERIRKLKPVVQQHRAEADQLRRLPDAVAQAFLEADVYRLQVPRRLGGAELDPLTAFDLIEEVSSYDGSAGWNMTIGLNGITLCGDLSWSWLESHFGSADCGLAVSGSPGRADPVDGGYLLSGKWTWASGLSNSKLLGGFATIMDGNEPRRWPSGAPDMRMFLVPHYKVTVLDAWHTGGMRGTGSTDWVADHVLIPADHVGRVFTEDSPHKEPIFRLPVTYFGLGLSGVALGVARGAIEGLKQLASDSPETFRNQAYVQYAMGKARALHESGFDYIRRAFTVIWNNVVSGRPHALEDKARARRAYVHGMDSAIAAVELCSEAAGGAAVHDTRVFARALRDVHAIRGHLILSRRFMELAGRADLDMPVGNPQF